MYQKLMWGIALGLAWWGRVQAATLEVCAQCPWQSVRQAVEAAAPGDVVRVRPGGYKEHSIQINKKLVLQGTGFPVLEGNDLEEILIITADSVRVEGFELRRAGKSQLKDQAAIRVRKARYFVIQQNRIVDAYFGIYLEHSSHGLVEGNVLLGTATHEASAGNAIHGWYGRHLEISSNYIKGHRDGVYLEFVDSSLVVNNISEYNVRYGLHYMFSNDDQYVCNVFRSNGAGVAVMFSKRIQMRENRFERNWGTTAYGLLLKEIYDADIQDNHFLYNTVGIFLEGATRISYQRNEFQYNGWAVQMTGGCLDNHFTRNNFLANTLDLVVNSRVNNNTFNGNYWSEYTGYDLNRDGTGDVPHRPVKLFSYILAQSPESIVLLRSFFIDLLNFSEKVSPALTPQDVADYSPSMSKIS